MTTSLPSTFSKIQERVQSSLNQLNENDMHLLDCEVHERSLTFRLGFYLQDNFPKWDVDCEYNKNGDEPKRVNDELRYPDVIIHQRGTDKNLFVIEAKTGWSNSDPAEDQDRIRNLISDLGYCYGLSLIFFKNGSHQLEWISKDGSFKTETFNPQGFTQLNF